MKASELWDQLRPRRPRSALPRALRRCHSIDDLGVLARRRLPRSILAYLDGGSDAEISLRRNADACSAIRLMPQVLRDVSAVDTRTVILGQEMAAPIILAPVGAARLFHPLGELAVAEAAAEAGIPYAVSTMSTFALEEIASSTDGALWFQLYATRDHGLARELMGRAQEAGFRVLVVTVDATVRSKRERELRAGLTLPVPQIRLRTLLDGAIHPRWWWRFVRSEPISFRNLVGPDEDLLRSVELVSQFCDGSISWRDLEWIREAWAGPIVLKGVVRADDALQASDAGVEGIVVSNHGGRQLDQVPATLELLPEVVDAVGDLVTVLVDSGIRRGTHVLAALALGARGCLVGRPYVYGLSAAGLPGVRHAVDILTGELKTAMALSGAASVAEIRADHVRRRTDSLG